MASIATNTATDVRSEGALLRAVILAMSDLTTFWETLLGMLHQMGDKVLTILASLVFIITQGTVERGKFTELIPLELILAFRDRGSLSYR